MQMDPPMAKFTKNDGIVSLMHCQECIFHALSTIYISIFKGISNLNQMEARVKIQ